MVRGVRAFSLSLSLAVVQPTLTTSLAGGAWTRARARTSIRTGTTNIRNVSRTMARAIFFRTAGRYGATAWSRAIQNIRDCDGEGGRSQAVTMIFVNASSSDNTAASDGRRVGNSSQPLLAYLVDVQVAVVVVVADKHACSSIIDGGWNGQWWANGSREC